MRLSRGFVRLTDGEKFVYVSPDHVTGFQVSLRRKTSQLL
jgi:hypothetical protein